MADPILTSELLEKYSNEKFGYGNPGVSEYPTVWFLGPEEKGSYEELQERVQAWFSAANSNESFVDIEIFHKQLDYFLLLKMGQRLSHFLYLLIVFL
jgi:hypothetical protein